MKEKDKPVFTLEKAISLASEYHQGQKDQSGRPYTEHLQAVAAQLHGDEAKMAGMLHDSIEDTGMTEGKLRSLGCPENVIQAIILVTHKSKRPSEEEYMADIKNIASSGNQIAVDVKWADLTHNSDLTRIAEPNEWDLARWAKYQKAKEILKPFLSKYLLEK